MQAMFIEPGNFKAWLTIEAAHSVADGMGGRTESWKETAVTYGHIEPVAAESRFGADQTLETHTHRITIRHREGVASGMRFRKGQRLFPILTVHDPDETGRYLVCRVKEQGL